MTKRLWRLKRNSKIQLIHYFLQPRFGFENKLFFGKIRGYEFVITSVLLDRPYGAHVTGFSFLFAVVVILSSH